MEVRGGKPLNPKSKNTVIREKTFLILILVCHSQTLVLFCSFWNSQKKILASVYERSYESSIIPPSEKPLLKILAARWFLLLWGFAFEKIRAKRVHSCFCFFLLLVLNHHLKKTAPQPSFSEVKTSELQRGHRAVFREKTAFLFFFFSFFLFLGGLKVLLCKAFTGSNRRK